MQSVIEFLWCSQYKNVNNRARENSHGGLYPSTNLNTTKHSAYAGARVAKQLRLHMDPGLKKQGE